MIEEIANTMTQESHSIAIEAAWASLEADRGLDRPEIPNSQTPDETLKQPWEARQ